MKALEKLREYANIDFGCDMSTHQEECLEAITELEALQQRSCDGRKYGKEEEEIECEDTKYFCTHTNISFKYYPPYNFYCNRYEAKPLS